MPNLFYPSRGAMMLAAIILKGRTGPSRGSQLFAAKAPHAREAAEALGCSKTHVAYLMNGDRTPSADMTERIAEAFGVPSWTWCEAPYVRDPVSGEWVAPSAEAGP